MKLTPIQWLLVVIAQLVILAMPIVLFFEIASIVVVLFMLIWWRENDKKEAKQVKAMKAESDRYKQWRDDPDEQNAFHERFSAYLDKKWKAEHSLQ